MNDFYYLTNIIINSVLILLNLFLIFNAGIFFFKLEGKPVTSSLLYIFLLASIVSVLASFNASLAKYFLYYSSIFHVLITTYSYSKKIGQSLFSNIFFKFIKTSILCIFIIIVYVVVSLKERFFYNAHDPYLFGIPFEILNANYSGRLKVFDNYPFEWTKFHFFNGAISSVLLLPSYSLNIFIYKFSKLILLNLSIFSFLEFFKPTKKQIIIIGLVLILFSSQFVWLYYTNGLVSLFLFLFLFFVIEYKNKIQEGVYLFLLFYLTLLFSSSTIRSLIPGFIILIFLFVTYFSQIRSQKKNSLFFFIIPIFSIGCMVLTGKVGLDNSTVSFDYKNYFYKGWNDLFFIRSSIIYFKQFIISFYKDHLFLFSIWIIVLFGIIVKYHKTFFSFSIHYNSKIKFYFLFYFLINLVSIIYYNNKYFFVISSISIFLIPFFFIFNINFFSKDSRNFLLVFLTSSLLQILFISPSSSIPNALLLDYIIFYSIVKKINQENILFKNLVLPLVFVIPFCSFYYMIIPQKSDRTTRSIILSEYFKKKDNEALKKEFDLNNLENDFIINSSIFGQRQRYSNFISDSISVSKKFINKN